MPRLTLLLGLCALAACSTSTVTDEPARESRGSVAQAFASAGAVLVDLEFDATLVADTMDPPRVRELIATQLTFLIGQLNGDRSVGWHDRAEYSVKTFGAEPGAPGQWRFTHHTKLPVAWGAGEPPPSYAVTLPLRVGPADQAAFAEEYAATCFDPEGAIAGAADASRLFLFYRPHRPGCSLSPLDVGTSTASVTRSAENSVGKFPEYHRVWDDDELDVVAIFGKEFDDDRPEDGGKQAYEAFLAGAERYGTKETGGAPLPTSRISGTLAAGRRVRIDAALIPAKLSEARDAFDEWYDARSADADLVVYSGHAGLGSNARTLTKKGVFRARKYVVVALNGCDTLAYLDRTLADRRAVLNPDDPRGTKYMDTITNVLGGYFRSGDETTLHLVSAFASAPDAPKTYVDLLSGIDPQQIAVVTGEEDNEFRPGMIPPRKNEDVDAGAPAPGPTPSTPAPIAGAGEHPTAARDDSGGCSLATAPARRSLAAVYAGIAFFAFLRRRRTATTMPAASHDAAVVDDGSSPRAEATAQPAQPPDFGGSAVYVGGAPAAASVASGAPEPAAAAGAFVAFRSSSGTSERIIVAS